MADTMLTFKNQNLSTFLTQEELRTKCPMAFKTTPTNPNLTERYSHANTATVIDDFAKLGWYPVDAKQCRPKKKSSGIRSFHMVAFQNENVRIMKNDGSGEIECYPRIILTNSHDGFSSFKFMVGMFRLICSNGLILGDKLAELSIRHINYDFNELRQVVAASIEQVTQHIAAMNKMNHTFLSEEQKRDFAIKAIRLRKGVSENDKLEIADESIEEVLTPRRKEDESNSLWHVFNVVQENIIKGGFSMHNSNGKARKQRPIKGIVKDIDINQKLYNFAEELMPLAA